MAFQEALGGAGKPHVTKYGRDIGRRGAHQRDCLGQEWRLDRVVTIERQDEVCMRKSNSGIPGRRQAAIF